MAQSSGLNPGSFHILVVDDEEEVLQTLCQLIEADGYQVTGASSGRSALELMKCTPVNLVLTDLMMPGINGWQLLRAIKKVWPDTSVVVLTGHVPEEGEAMLTDREADGYLVKPVDRRRMQALFKALLFSRNLGRQAEVVAVDDDSNALHVIDLALSRRGLFVTTFQDPGDALQHMREHPPDLALVDLHILGFSGFDLCQAIRSDPKTAQVALLMVTSDASRENVARAVQLGMNGFVAKPFDLKELADKALQVLRQVGGG